MADLKFSIAVSKVILVIAIIITCFMAFIVFAEAYETGHAPNFLLIINSMGIWGAFIMLRAVIRIQKSKLQKENKALSGIINRKNG